ncbi:MAG: hypothetical protein NZ585_01525 [Chloracidobacterium sp.]|nr:hypothetical protein [Chloracidobacterium sp.]MDW8216314.1 hypothetical protein [Acidobacteriota bacterium]
MKYTLDLDQLLAEGKITTEEYERLRAYAARATGSLVFNLLIGFSVIAVSGGALALLPKPTTATALGLVVLGGGLGLLLRQAEMWRLLANICLLVGALLTGGGVIAFGNAQPASFWTVFALFTVTTVVAQSSLLAVLATLMLSACLGVGTGYGHAAYFIFVEKPLLTVVVFTLLAIALYQLSKRAPSNYEGVTLAAARTSVLIANLGFWVGSLWGDWLWMEKDFHLHSQPPIPAFVFALAWAGALLVAALWAWRRNRRWVVNTVAVFGGIHFYTQWFEQLGASPETVLAAGVLALGFTVGLRFLNLRMQASALHT